MAETSAQGRRGRIRDIVAVSLVVALAAVTAALWLSLRSTAQRHTDPAVAPPPARGTFPTSLAPGPAAASRSAPSLPTPASSDRPPGASRTLAAAPVPAQADSDRFEGWALVRPLVAVGDLQLGVRQDSTIKDEIALKKVLARLGEEMDRLGRQAAAGPRPDYQAVLERHRAELARHMDGEVQVRGRDWMAGAEVGDQPSLEGRPVERRRPE